MTRHTDASTPTAWLLLGPKAGDNTQVRALGEALARQHGFAIREHTLAFRHSELITNVLLGPNLAGVAHGRETLTQPWPDVTISAGRRNEPVARWIQRASDAHSRVVHIGRPWARPERFDLIVTTPQYELPPADNVMTVPLPLLPDRKPAHADPSTLPFAHLPRPHLAVLVGGNSGAFRFTEQTGIELARIARAQAAQTGASLLLTTSPRTPQATTVALRRALGDGVYFHDWHAGPREANPYHHYLDHADAFVVTGESASMLAEAVATGRPVTLYAPRRTRRGAWRWKPLTFYLGQWFGPRRMRRHIERLHAQVIEAGYAQWPGTAPGRPRATYDASATLTAVAERVAALAGK